MDTDVFTYSIPNLKDNTIAVSTKVETHDYTKVTTDLEPYETLAQFQLTVTIRKWPSSIFKFVYYDPDEADRKLELAFKLKDYCLGVTYSVSSISLPGKQEITGFVSVGGVNKMTKEILSTPSEFIVSYLTYKQYSTEKAYGCGGLDLIYES